MSIETTPRTSGARARCIDPLTGFGTRDQLLADLVGAIGAGGLPNVLALVDLGGLRTYVEDYGRIEAEALLVRIANLLSEALGTEATCYRPRKDELAVLITAGVSDPFGAVDAALDTVNTRLSEFRITLTQGSVTVPSEAEEPFAALALADARLHVRAAGRLSRERRRKPRL